MRGIVLLVALGLVAGCQAQPAVERGRPAAADGRAAEAALLQRIEAEVGDAACSSSAQCRTVAIGAKACGGPARWMAWSVASTSAERLAPLAKALEESQRRRIDAEGMMSNCSVEMDPGATCVQAGATPGQPGRCALARTRMAS